MKTLKIGLVEDNPLHVKLFHDCVEGMKVDIEHIEKIAPDTLARLGNVHVIVLDLCLPGEDGPSLGVSTLKAVRSGLPHMPVIIFTGVKDDLIRDLCLTHGADAFFNKDSIDPDKFRRAITDALESAERRVESIASKLELVRDIRDSLARLELTLTE